MPSSLCRNAPLHLLVTPLASPRFPDPTFHPTVIFSFLCCSTPSNHILLKVPAGRWKMLVHLANLPRSRAHALDYQGFLQVPQGPELPPLETQFPCLACCMGVVSCLWVCSGLTAGFATTIRVIPTAPHPFQDHLCLLIGPSLGEIAHLASSFGLLPLRSPDLPGPSILTYLFPPLVSPPPICWEL